MLTNLWAWLGWDGVIAAALWGIAAITLAAFSPIAPILAQIAINFDWSALAVIITLLGGFYMMVKRFTNAETKLDAIGVEQSKINETLTDHITEDREFHESIRVELARRA